MDDNLMRFLGWIAAGMMIVLAAGTFLVRYAGFVNLVNHVEQVALSDSVVWRENTGQVQADHSSEPGSAAEARLLRPFRGGLVSICDGRELKGIIMLAGADGTWDEPITIDGQPVSESSSIAVPNDARYRVSYTVNGEGYVTGTTYELIP